MLVDWRGVKIVLTVLAAVAVLCVIDLSCTSSRDPGVLARVKDELKVGRREMTVLRRDQVAEQLNSLRVLNKELVRKGELRRSRELTRLIVDLERQYQHLQAEVERSSLP